LARDCIVVGAGDSEDKDTLWCRQKHCTWGRARPGWWRPAVESDHGFSAWDQGL